MALGSATLKVTHAQMIKMIQRYFDEVIIAADYGTEVVSVTGDLTMFSIVVRDIPEPGETK